MTYWWLLTHHVLAALIGVVTFFFAAAVLSQRRPSGSAAAWLLLLVLLPYVGIPLYLSFGGRKVAQRRLRAPSRGARSQPASIAAAPSTSQVDWLADGVAAYRRFLDEIAGAQRTIRVETFIVGDDVTGRGLLQALTQRAAAGVEVHLLLDDFLARHAPQAELAKLAAAGGFVARFMPLLHVPFRGRANLRNHRKIALFDGERAIVGGMNLADEYMGPEPSRARFKDLSIVVDDACVSELDAIFRADWAFAGGRALVAAAPPARASALRVVPSGPDSPTDDIYDALLTAIFRAERRVWVATPYFVPDDGLAHALEIAARRQIDVRVLVPARSNHLLADLAAAPCLRDLAAAGGKVQRYLPGMLHAKTLLVDDTLAVVGSANFDMRSLFLDYEIAIFLAGAAETQQLGRWFEEALASSLAGPPESRGLRKAAENLCRLVAPLI
jgi:cardiolipin synthase A/B